MQFRGLAVIAVFWCVGGVWAQTPPPPATPASGGSAPIFKTETRIVPVDVVVTDKKGNYIHDLAQKDFKVYEDNKEQPIKSFSFEADPASPFATQKRYMVLFFDVSSMSLGDQAQARQSAVKFIDANAGPNRLMAIVNFGGGMQIAQNFTDDIERLKAVAGGTKISSISTNPAPTVGGRGIPRLGSEAQFGARNMVLALRDLAKNLSEVPGRKTLVLFSAGFPMTQEMYPEVQAAVDACNRANVAIYPIDVRGLMTVPFATPRGAVRDGSSNGNLAMALPVDLARSGVLLAGSPVLRIASFLAAPQRGGVGGGAGGGTTSGGTGGGAPGGGGGGGAAAPGAGGGAGGGSRVGGSGGTSAGGAASNPGGTFGGGGRTGAPGGPGSTGAGGGRGATGNNGGFGGGGNNNPNGGRGGFGNDPNNRNGRQIIVPPIPESATTNQQVLYMLADGTGGFVSANSNDLLGNLQKINRDQNEYYLIAYAPPESNEGTCHVIKVKVSRGGANVRARTGYCNVKSADALAGKPAERQLETQVTATKAPTMVTKPMQTAYFYTASNTARVMVSLDIPTETLKFEKLKGKMHSEVNILGIAYRSNGDVAARFSDAKKFDLEDKKAVDKFTSEPYHYENQFDISSGEYTLKVAFNAGGDGFGKLESPLKVDVYDTKQFGISSVALIKSIEKVDAATVDEDLVEGKTPLVAAGMHFTPAGSTRFKTTDNPTMYFEIYDPLIADSSQTSPVQLAVRLRILDRATSAQQMDSGGVQVSNFIRKGNPVVPVGLKLPLTNIKPGNYKLEMTAEDSAGRQVIRLAEFEVQ